jgi:hypothetical protein
LSIRSPKHNPLLHGSRDITGTPLGRLVQLQWAGRKTQPSCSLVATSSTSSSTLFKRSISDTVQLSRIIPVIGTSILQSGDTGTPPQSLQPLPQLTRSVAAQRLQCITLSSMTAPSRNTNSHLRPNYRQLCTTSTFTPCQAMSEHARLDSSSACIRRIAARRVSADAR